MTSIGQLLKRANRTAARTNQTNDYYCCGATPADPAAVASVFHSNTCRGLFMLPVNLAVATLQRTHSDAATHALTRKISPISAVGSIAPSASPVTKPSGNQRWPPSCRSSAQLSARSTAGAAAELAGTGAGE